MGKWIYFMHGVEIFDELDELPDVLLNGYLGDALLGGSTFPSQITLECIDITIEAEDLFV